MSVYIIAEAGVNHNGSIDLAKKLIMSAKEAGADCIKFQTFKAEAVVSRNAKKAPYQVINTHNDESQLEMVKKLELPYEYHSELMDYCDSVGIDFLSTPFDIGSVSFLAELGIKKFKIPSSELTNLPYLLKAASYKIPIILSTGLANLDEVEATVGVLKENGSSEITLLHCTTEYPAPFDSINLNAMLILKEHFNLPVGYSDHSVGISIPPAAAALGATVIEKHFTLDKTMEGPDHVASLEPDELKAMVQAIRDVETAMGDGVKVPSEAEKKNINVMRKSIVAARAIKVGEVFTEENLTVKRPGDGLSPMKWFDVIGKEAERDYKEEEQIEKLT